LSRQLTHHSTAFTERQFPLILLCDGVSAPANIGSLFRLADAFNIEKLVLCGKNMNLASARLQKTARGTLGKVAFEQLEDPLEACQRLKKQGYLIFALEITDDSLPLNSVDFSGMERLVLVLGNEISGIGKEVLELADKRLHINMFGKNSSMNVAQSAGIALYEITKSLQPFQ